MGSTAEETDMEVPRENRRKNRGMIAMFTTKSINMISKYLSKLDSLEGRLKDELFIDHIIFVEGASSFLCDKPSYCNYESNKIWGNRFRVFR